MVKRKRLQKEDKEEMELKRCIVSNVKMPRDMMVRFVIGPDAEIAADIEARLPGRGFWLSARRDVIQKASARSYFVKVARMKVGVPSDLADRVESLLVRKFTFQVDSPFSQIWVGKHYLIHTLVVRIQFP